MTRWGSPTLPGMACILVMLHKTCSILSIGKKVTSLKEVRSTEVRVPDVSVCLSVCRVPGKGRMDGGGRTATDRVFMARWHRERHHWDPYVEQTLHSPTPCHRGAGNMSTHVLHDIELASYSVVVYNNTVSM